MARGPKVSTQQPALLSRIRYLVLFSVRTVVLALDFNIRLKSCLQVTRPAIRHGRRCSSEGAQQSGEPVRCRSVAELA